MRLSPHFTLAEATQSATADRLGISNAPDPETLEAMLETARGMEGVRSIVGKPILVTSWYRNPEVNAAVGGSPTSAHVSGRAVDFKVDGMTAMEVATAIARSPLWFDQLILYSNRVHIGWRASDATPPDRRKSRWREMKERTLWSAIGLGTGAVFAFMVNESAAVALPAFAHAVAPFVNLVCVGVIALPFIDGSRGAMRMLSGQSKQEAFADLIFGWLARRAGAPVPPPSPPEERG